MVIYKCTNLVNGKVYIGQTVQKFEVRVYDHLCQSKGKTCYDYFHSALKKYGEGNFTWEILVKANSQEELDELERFWIEKLKTTEDSFGYNLQSGGKRNTRHSEKTKEKLRTINLGKSLSEETKKKMSNTRKGRGLSEEWKLNISKGLSGKKSLGKSLSKLGKKNPQFGLPSVNRKQIRQLSFDGVELKIYTSIMEATKQLNLSESSIANCLSKRSKSAGGFYGSTFKIKII